MFFEKGNHFFEFSSGLIVSVSQPSPVLGNATQLLALLLNQQFMEVLVEAVQIFDGIGVLVFSFEKLGLNFCKDALKAVQSFVGD
jgi:hypothetical protein